MSGCGCSRTDSLCIEHAALFLTAQTTLLHATTSFSFECDYCRERLASLQLLDRHKLKHQIAARLHFRAKRQQRQLQRRQLQQETGAAQSHLQSSTTESTPVESPQALSTQLQSSALRGQNTQPENDFGPRVKVCQPVLIFALISFAYLHTRAISPVLVSFLTGHDSARPSEADWSYVWIP
eukprot:m.201940 g.201940  ORF g.201940 m.201940 type:complete len:181 (+) comp53832_c0_seq22:250-792(+)